MKDINRFLDNNLSFGNRNVGVREEDDVHDLTNHVRHLAMQGLTWDEARDELQEIFHLTNAILKNAKRVYLTATQNVA